MVAPCNNDDDDRRLKKTFMEHLKNVNAKKTPAPTIWQRYTRACAPLPPPGPLVSLLPRVRSGPFSGSSCATACAHPQYTPPTAYTSRLKRLFRRDTSTRALHRLTNDVFDESSASTHHASRFTCHIICIRYVYEPCTHCRCTRTRTQDCSLTS